MSKKIVFVIDVMRKGGGAQKILPLVLTHLQRHGFEVSLVVLKKTPLLVEIPHIPTTYCLESEEQKILPHSFVILDRLTRLAEDAQLLVSFMDFMTSYFVSLSATLAKIPYYIFVRCEPSCVSKSFDYPEINADIYALCLEHAQRVVCNSATLVADVRDNFGVDDSKIVLLPNPIDTERIQSLALHSAGLHEKRGGEVWCFAVGRLVEQKNYVLLLEAFKILKDNNIYLFIIGEGEQRSALEAYINDHALKVELLGFVENIFAYLKHADIFIHCALYEGFPNVVLEAAALAKPLILSDIRALGDVFTNGHDALFFRHDDARDLAQKILCLAHDTHKQQSLVSHLPRLLEHYNIETFEQKILWLFKDYDA